MTSPDRSHAVYVISVAAELAGMHPQTLRIYERKGLLDPRARPAATVATASRHRPAAPHPGSRRATDEPRRHPAGHGARGTRTPSSASRLDGCAAPPVVRRRGGAPPPRRDLVPLRQQVALFGKLPSIFERDRRGLPVSYCRLRRADGAPRAARSCRLERTVPPGVVSARRQLRPSRPLHEAGTGMHRSRRSAALLSARRTGGLARHWQRTGDGGRGSDDVRRPRHRCRHGRRRQSLRSRQPVVESSESTVRSGS